MEEQDDMVELDREKIAQISGRGGLNIVQATLLGLEVPLRKGCRQQLLWRQIPKTLFKRVLRYTDIKRPARVLKDLQKQGELWTDV